MNSSPATAVEVWPDTVTVTSTVPVPAGLVAVQLEVELQEIPVAALFEPKSTVVSPEVAENPVPVIVTVVPPEAGPDVGLILVMVGAPPDVDVLVTVNVAVPDDAA